MALGMDKVIEEILRFRKYKVWRYLDDHSLPARARGWQGHPVFSIFQLLKIFINCFSLPVLC